MTENDIHKLYSLHDEPCGENVVSFHPPLGQEAEEILVDIHALMDDTKTRQHATLIFKKALHEISENLVGDLVKRCT